VAILTPEALRERTVATVREMLTPETNAAVDDEMLPVVYSPFYQPLLDAFTALVAETRREQLEKDARAICQHCWNGHQAAFQGSPDPSYNLGWFHPTVSPGTVPCKAAALRAQDALAETEAPRA